MDIMEWNEVHDPEGRFVFDIANSVATGSYNPEDIQKLIDEKGVEAMVAEVNAHFIQTQKRTAYRFGHIDGKDAVISSVI